MSDKTILASSIANVPHFVAFDTLAKKRFSNLELDKLLVYIIDTVDSSAIPFLAEQFDVLGYKGMRLATTEQQQREVIKRGIEIKRYTGTVWAIKEALKTIGYQDATLVEHASEGENGWATFRIELADGDNNIDPDRIDDLVKMILQYKNERSHLLDVSYRIVLEDDAIAITDDSQEHQSIDEGDPIFMGGNFTYNGEFRYNGEKNHTSDSDILELEIIPV